MPWTSKTKDIAVVKTVPHSNSSAGIVGRAPGIPGMSFSPQELFGASARCSHLHAITPGVVTSESLMIQALLEHHVDDISSDFAVLSSAHRFKDFVRSYFAGTIAQGLGYLAMINDGYVWSDHFENLGSTAPASRSPDFVFAGIGAGVALMESKGTRSATASHFDTTVSKGYIDQVEPHLGHTVGGVTATHGYCIGASLQSSVKADLRIHHTAVPAGATSGGAPATASIAVVQRGNYANVFNLVHSEALGRAIRIGDGSGEIVFDRFHWRRRRWLFSSELQWHLRYWHIYNQSPSPFLFAIEENIAQGVLRQFLNSSTREALDIEVLPREEAQQEGSNGAAFPDGLAVLRHGADVDYAGSVRWDPRTGEFI